MDSKLVRVSIANLAWYARVKGNKVRYPFAILNPSKLKKKEHQYMALGGGAMLSETGKGILEEVVGATGFEFDQKTGFYDARFQIREDELSSVFKTFSNINGPSMGYEQDRTLDIIAELSGEEFTDYGGILTPDEVKTIELLYIKSVRQKPSEAGADTSARASVEMPTRRLFRIYELVMPEEVFKKFKSSSVVRFLTTGELKTTDGGGKAGRTFDGRIIQNNLFYLE